MNTKLLAALIVVGVLAIAVVGLVAAQVAITSPTPNGTSTGPANGGFFGWIGRCMGFGNAGYYGTQAAPSTAYPSQAGQPVNITVTDPNTGASTTYQGYQSYGYGCGGMMGFRP